MGSPRWSGLLRCRCVVIPPSPGRANCASPPGPGLGALAPQPFGPLGQLGKEQTLPDAENLFSRYGVGFGQTDSTPHGGTYSVGFELLEYVQQQDGGPTETVPEAPEAYGNCSGSHTTRAASYETAPTLAPWSSPEVGMVVRHSPGPSNTGLPPNLHPVVRPCVSPGWSAPGTAVRRGGVSGARPSLNESVRTTRGPHPPPVCSIHLDDPVFAVAGEDVILPCSVKPNISVVDMRVEWFRPGLKDSQLVHLYDDHEDRNTEQIESYRGRTELIHQELQTGNASLKLLTVQVSDEGRYKCFIQSKSWYDDAIINVKVEVDGRPPVITVDGFDHSGGLRLQCESEGWYPEPVLEWLNSEEVSLSSETTEGVADGFSVKHTITVHHRDDKIHCKVKLRHHVLETQIITTMNVILDADTAHLHLIVSRDGKQVKSGNRQTKGVDGRKDRFNDYLGVLGKNGFSSRCFYFEVQVKGQTEWYLGVTRESVNRKGLIRLSPMNGYWTVCLRDGGYWAYELSHVSLSLSVDPQRVGVFVDYETGLVSFYDVQLACSATLSRTVPSSPPQHRSRPRPSSTSCPDVVLHLPPFRRRQCPSLLVAVGALLHPPEGYGSWVDSERRMASSLSPTTPPIASGQENASLAGPSGDTGSPPRSLISSYLLTFLRTANTELKHQSPSKMKFICLTLLIISGITDSRSEQYEVVGAADPVFVVAGEDVILPCSVKPNISVVDMRVEWFRPDLKNSLVHLYEDHEDRNAESYGERTELNHQELQRGDASLKLSSVRVSDEGRYKCFIQSKSWYDDATVDVSVEAVGRPPVITVDGFDDSGGLHLQCESEGWYPEPVLEWLNSEGVRFTHRNTDGFSVKHSITLTRVGKIHCRVKLRHHVLETQIITKT
ncbi:uncharacterized protein LOC131534874 [Onychostoma macrolepis]|uniref:uncharacterized protein LOC131534874 n=1 Tax=Onychostoma macrolepis TaxID=369639 RepID=UPI00272BEDF5|nr:uncharacterized protein LOC131534874 [Onychostoma macrolepis]